MEPQEENFNNQPNTESSPVAPGDDSSTIQPQQSIRPRSINLDTSATKAAANGISSFSQSITAIGTGEASAMSKPPQPDVIAESPAYVPAETSFSTLNENSVNIINPLQSNDQQPSSEPHQNVLFNEFSSTNNSNTFPSETQAQADLPMNSNPSVLRNDIPKKKSPAKILLLTIVALILAGLGGGAYAYTAIINNSPEKVLADAISTTATDLINRKPFKGSGKFTFRSTDKKIPLTMAVKFDSKYIGDDSSVDLNIDTKIGGDMGFTLALSANMVVENYDTIYIKINNVQKTIEQFIGINGSSEATMMLDMYSPVIKKIDGRWIKIDKQSLSELGLSLDETDKKVEECMNAIKAFRLDPKEQKSIKQAFKNNPFAIVSEELKSEAIEGSASYHYKLDLNQEAGMKFTKEIFTLSSLSEIKNKCEIKPDDLDKELEDLKKKTDKEIKQKPIIEIWVNKQTKHINKFKITANSDEASIETESIHSINAKNIKVEIPKDAVKVSDLKNELQNLLFFTDGQALGWNSWIRP